MPTRFVLESATDSQWVLRPITSDDLSGAIELHSDNEMLAAPDGVTVAFSLANIPNPPESLLLFMGHDDPTFNGWQFQHFGVSYTLSTNVVTFATAPSLGSGLIAYYRYKSVDETFDSMVFNPDTF